jgi:hypothetical protein
MIAFKPVLIVLFWATTIYGAFDAVRGMRKIRSARKYKDCIFAWSEPPVSDIKCDTISWLTTSIHWMTVVMIGLVEFLILVVGSLPLSLSSLWIFPLLGGIVAGIGYMWGTVVFHPIALYLAGNRNYAITNEGILFAGNLIPWSAFTHFSFDRENNLIRLWSSSFYGVVALMFSPPTEHLAKVVDSLQSHLPNENAVSTPNLMWQLAFPLIMAVGCGIPVFITIPSTLLLSPEIALIVNGILIYILMLLGGKGLLWALFGGKMRPATVES